jgi:two-component system chemotaxis response regulator CheB
VLSDSSFLLSLGKLLQFGASIFIRQAANEPGQIENQNAAADLVLIDNRDIRFGPEILNKIDLPKMVVAPNPAAGFKMLEQGADEMITAESLLGTPNKYVYNMLKERFKRLLDQRKIMQSRVAKYADSPLNGKIIAIGASAGGTETILNLLKQMPYDAPPIVIVQHMPPIFTRLYAERADKHCAIEIWEARDGDKLANGLALIAPGGFHMVLEKEPDGYAVHLHKGERVQKKATAYEHCPAVDVLFESVAKAAGPDAVGVILTGMGADGAEGLLAMRKQGGYTIGQDEDTSIVYGMPKAAYDIGAVCVQLPIYTITREILKHAYTPKTKRRKKTNEIPRKRKRKG